MTGARRAASALIDFSPAECTAGKARKKGSRKRRGWRLFFLSCGGLHLRQCRGDLLQVRDDGNVVVLEPSDFAGLVHDGNRSASDSLVCEIHSILLAHRSARMKIRQ